jgi:hypothetical protein
VGVLLLSIASCNATEDSDENDGGGEAGVSTGASAGTGGSTGGSGGSGAGKAGRGGASGNCISRCVTEGAVCGDVPDSCGNPVSCGTCAVGSCSDHHCAAPGHFQIVSENGGSVADVVSIAGFGPEDVYFARSVAPLIPGSIDHYDGISITAVLETPLSIFALSATPSGKLFGAGAQGTFIYFDGVTWREGSEWLAATPSSNLFSKLWAVSETDFWAGTDGLGDIYHYDGAGFRLQNLPTTDSFTDTYALWGTASNNVYASVYQEGLFHFDGSTWTKVMHPTAIISAIHGTGPNDIWAVGTEILHYNGSSWRLHQAGAAFANTGILNRRYHAVWASPSGRVWIAGQEGVVLAGDTTGFSLVDTAGFSGTLFAIWGSGESDIWAGGSFETILHYTAEGD